MNKNKGLSKTGIVNENGDLRVTRRVAEIRLQDQGVESALENQRLTAELRRFLKVKFNFTRSYEEKKYLYMTRIPPWGDENFSNKKTQTFSSGVYARVRGVYGP